MADDDAALLDRLRGDLQGMQGLEQTSPAPAETVRPKSHADWLQQQYNADPGMWRDYLHSAARHPHLFQVQDSTAIAIHVEPVLRHFGKDGLTRQAYFRAIAAEPQVVLQKPDTVIHNVEAVMQHYDADRGMRSDYLQAALAQPVLLQTAPEAVIATMEAAADHLEAQGVTRRDFLRQAIDRPRIFTHAPDAARPRMTTDSGLAMPDTSATGQVAVSSQLPSTLVNSPALYVSYIAPVQARGL